ncbi:hypothetical protein [Rhodopirellula bahusiensis]|uniref:hypothetical protein n=1 Tax=Rhodopirellula bahusiensis TaxID=2014065 RepID=UPI0032642F23
MKTCFKALTLLTVCCVFAGTANAEYTFRKVFVGGDRVVIYGTPKVYIQDEQVRVKWPGTWKYQIAGKRMTGGNLNVDKKFKYGSGFEHSDSSNGLKVQLKGEHSKNDQTGNNELQMVLSVEFSYKGSTAKLATKNISQEYKKIPSDVYLGSFPKSFAHRFQAAREWSTNTGHSHAFPTFAESKEEVKRNTFQVVAFPANVAHKSDVLISDLKKPKSDLERVMRAHRWGSSQKKRALPDFNINRAGDKYGIVWFPLSVTEKPRDIAASELNNTSNPIELFKSVHKWAVKHHYVSGYPNGEAAIRNGKQYYGVILIKPGKAEVANVTARK